MTLADQQTRVLERIGEPVASPAYYSLAEVTAALNWAQRLFVLLSLCLETTVELRLAAAARGWYHMRKLYPDWIVPLRIRLANDTSAGADTRWGVPLGDQALFGQGLTPGIPASSAPKLRPTTLQGMAARSVTWLTDIGTPGYYAFAARELLTVDKSPAVQAPLLITYARGPVNMALPGDSPEIPGADQPALIDGAIALLRTKEGGQEMQKAQAGLMRFVEAAKLRGRQVRARSLAQRYDVLPVELERVDLSRLLKIRPDLPPVRKEITWPLT